MAGRARRAPRRQLQWQDAAQPPWHCWRHVSCSLQSPSVHPEGSNCTAEFKGRAFGWPSRQQHTWFHRSLTPPWTLFKPCPARPKQRRAAASWRWHCSSPPQPLPPLPPGCHSASELLLLSLPLSEGLVERHPPVQQCVTCACSSAAGRAAERRQEAGRTGRPGAIGSSLRCHAL